MPLIQDVRIKAIKDKAGNITFVGVDDAGKEVAADINKNVAEDVNRVNIIEKLKRLSKE